jgi:uncharacterized protein YecE (DUF72 family)
MKANISHPNIPARTTSIIEWRARKEERREKQRQANTGRAMKMRTARLASALPLNHSEKLPAVNIGCSGWFYWHWRGAFYPQTLPTKEWFAHYARTFSTVELNAPFYSWPTVNNVKLWLRQAGKRNFIYTVKVCELITHMKRFRRTENYVKDFGHIADLLGPHMGCFLFQLPPSFHYTPARLKNILAQLDPARRNVVEFRHRSWWHPKVFAAFKQAGVIFCSCSAPKLPDELISTTDEVYIRFHGLTKWYRHDYTPEALAIWVERIQSAGCRRVWAYFNNDRDAYAIKNAKELTKQLRKAFKASQTQRTL